MPQLENIEATEKRLWNAADMLLANSNYASNEYFMPVMGLIFLRRAFREGLDEETLAIFDLLNKPDLTPAEVKRIKAVAVELLTTLKAEKLRIAQWREKEATRDAVRVAILNFLYDERTVLPVERYTEEEVNTKVDAVFIQSSSLILYCHCLTIPWQAKEEVYGEDARSTGERSRGDKNSGTHRARQPS